MKTIEDQMKFIFKKSYIRIERHSEETHKKFRNQSNLFREKLIGQ
ncbi:hypothetical protein CAEBREN_30338 [Caenorhabditis brenneri]|uniref:Uncharacterized protein n=1 Tax=Caenorhabditis brenneri TaxID=135651 RepID=G0NUS6_CAEBE|nr:hypothetical protein CAEBREN_30338 [Caenorhabditis brenneri]